MKNTRQLKKVRPLCPECYSASSYPLPSKSFVLAGRVIMSFRCKNCAWVFNEVTGIKEGEDRPELSQEDMDRQKVEGQVNKVGSLEGLSQEERLAKIRQVLKGIR